MAGLRHCLRRRWCRLRLRLHPRSRFRLRLRFRPGAGCRPRSRFHLHRRCRPRRRCQRFESAVTAGSGRAGGGAVSISRLFWEVMRVWNSCPLSGSTFHFIGDIDEVRVYDHALTQAQVDVLYAN